MNDNKKIEQFFDYNLKVKQLLNDLIPTEMDFYDKNYRTEYVTKLLNDLVKIETYLNKMMIDYNIPDNILNSFIKKIKQLKNKIDSFSFIITLRQGYSSVLDFVHNNITYMRPEFNKSIKENFIGYYVYYGENVLPPITINEFAHYVHSFVINNQDFYFEAPLIKENKNIPYQETYLRGLDNEIGNNLYNKIINSNIHSDHIDIINLNKKIIMMAKDLGHATVIEIDLNEKIFVKYFIPKNINKEKNSLLKGVYENDEFVIGNFETDNLIDDLLSLLNGIAVDKDIEYLKFIK